MSHSNLAERTSSKSVHVCQLIAERWLSGGMEKHVVELSNGLQPHRQVSVIADRSYTDFLHPKIKFVKAKMNWARNNPFLLIDLIRKLQKLKPDVVHAHGKKAGQLVAMIAPFIAAKTVVTIHNQCHEKWWMHKLDSIVCVSSTVAENLPRLPTTTIHNGISSIDPTSNTKHLPLDRYNVISVGSLTYRKGFDTLIHACADLPVNVHIVGAGPKYDALHQLALSLGYGSRIYFHGHSDHVPELLACADLTVIASRREGFSYVFAESLFAKTPVVSTQVPVACEYLADQYLVPIDRPDQLRDAIAHCMYFPEQTNKNFEALFDQAQVQFNLDLMVQNSLKHYAQLTHKNIEALESLTGEFDDMT